MEGRVLSFIQNPSKSSLVSVHPLVPQAIAVDQPRNLVTVVDYQHNRVLQSFVLNVRLLLTHSHDGSKPAKHHVSINR